MLFMLRVTGLLQLDVAVRQLNILLSKYMATCFG